MPANKIGEIREAGKGKIGGELMIRCAVTYGLSSVEVVKLGDTPRNAVFPLGFKAVCTGMGRPEHSQ
jgi:hypothetical protein